MSDGAKRSAAPAEWTFTEDPNQKPRESCVKHFDALWFCYSPVFQLQQLYRYGEVDDCTRHWRDFYNCLKKRTKFANQVVESQKAEPLWELRTPEEACAFWQEQFGSAAAATAESAGVQQSMAPHDQPGLQETESEKLTVA